MKIGILAVQGDFDAHARMLDRLGVARSFVRAPDDLAALDGVILPGGESTTHLKVMTEEGLLDISVARNGYGRQLASHILRAPTKLRQEPVEMVFIRAPIIESTGPAVEILAEDAGHPVLVQQGRILASTFHPELTDDTTVHRHFLDMISARN